MLHTTKRIDLLNRSRRRLDIRLDSGNTDLQEVVVVGYSTSSRLLRGQTAGFSITATPNSSPAVRGSRALGADYFPDGQRMSGYPSPTFPDDVIRTDFRDCAYWRPHLTTDQRGEAVFQVTFPDDLTAWRHFALGMDRRKRAGVAQASTRALMPLQAQLALPRFLVAGDQAIISGRATNFTGDTLSARSIFIQEDSILVQTQYRLAAGRIDTALLIAPAEVDSIQLRYQLATDRLQDGEMRSLPVFPVGSRETSGYFAVLESDTSLTFAFDPDKGPVTCYAQDNTLDLLLSDIEYLKEYPYDCNEQTASRLVGLLLEKAVREQLGQPFSGQKELQKAIRRLSDAQRTDGSWGWWPRGETNFWITAYVLWALQKAEQSGYPAPAYERGLRYLTSVLPKIESRSRLMALEVLARAGQLADYEQELLQLDAATLGLTDRLRILHIRQLAGLEWSLDTLAAHRKATTFGGYYWGEEGPYRRDNAVQATLQAYELYGRLGAGETQDRIIRYLLGNRHYGLPGGRRSGWRNTFETAQVLAAILPRLVESTGERTAGSRAAQLTVNGRRAERFPFTQSYPETTKLSLSKTGGLPLFVTAYQEYFDPSPKAVAESFVLETHFEQDGRRTESLARGLPAELVVDLEVKAAAEYVLLEIPVPGGCAYADRNAGRRFPEAHREYRRGHVAVFCEQLPAGRYTFRVALEPRFEGRYTLNPARVEQMYFPVFFGRNEGRVIFLN